MTLFKKGIKIMKIYLLKNIEGVGMAGEIVEAKEGYVDNFLIPRKMAVKITASNELFYKSKVKHIDNRKEVIASQTSMMAEKIKDIKVVLKRKMHDDGKLYAAVSPVEVADLLSEMGFPIIKTQVVMEHAIKEKGTFEVTIKLTPKLQPKFHLKIVSEGHSSGA